MKTMKTRVYESMIPIQIGDFKVRIWRSEDELGQQTTDDISAWTQSLAVKKPDDLDFENRKSILEAILKFPRIAAVEILDPFGFGCLVYNDWP